MRRILGPKNQATLVSLMAITLIVLGSCILLDRPLVRGDGLAYFMWLDSLARDADLNLANQATKFAHVNTYQVFVHEKTGRYASVFPFGNALLLIPFYWLGMLADKLSFFHINDAYFIQHQGTTFAYSFFPMLGTNLYALAAVLLAYFAARRIAPNVAAMFSALALFFGTPLWYYSTIEPLNSHVCGTVAVCLLLFLFTAWCTLRREPTQRKETWLWLAMGLAAGMATLVRWQLALFALPVGIIPLKQRGTRLALAFALGFAALSWLVPYSWWKMFGSPWVIPAAEQNRAAFLVWPVYLKQILFSGEKGLFIWAPLTALSVLGWITLYGKKRILSLVLAAMFALQALINASVYDWWAGWSFGMRRMIELYPAFGLGLASLSSLSFSRKRWQHVYQIGVHLLVAASVAFTILLLFSHLNFINTVLDRPQGDTALREIYYQLRQSSFRITWLVIREHYGPWAWHQPGP
ncbi:MAG: hypothetical protein ACP5Q1_06120 [Anaerolineae bacterium]